MKILIVDDNAENIYLLKAMLEGEGYEAVSAENGKEALKRLRKDSFAMIISDILMPVMDGFQFCRECKSNPEWRHIPFVFYTATYTDPKDEAFALSLGAERFIAKPEDPENFLAMVREILSSHRKGGLVASVEPAEDEKVYFRQYNEALIRKLEDKLVELQNLNRQMHESRSFLQDVLRTTPSAVFTVDTDRTITSWNPTAERITGYRADEVLGRKCTIVESPTCGEECRLFDERFPKPGEYRECILVHKDGRKLTVLKNFDLLVSASGEITGAWKASSISPSGCRRRRNETACSPCRWTCSASPASTVTSSRSIRPGKKRWGGPRKNSSQSLFWNSSTPKTGNPPSGRPAILPKTKPYSPLKTGISARTAPTGGFPGTPIRWWIRS